MDRHSCQSDIVSNTHIVVFASLPPSPMQCSEEMMGRYSVYAKNEVGTCLARVVNLRNTIAVRAAKGGQPGEW